MRFLHIYNKGAIGIGMVLCIFSFGLHPTIAQLDFPTTSWDQQDISTFSLSLHIPPVQQGYSLGPVLSARSALAVDIDSGLILYEKNVYERLPVASLTKLMTALVTLNNNDSSQTITIPKDVSLVEPSKMYLRPGDVLSIKQLVIGMLVHSANDAAYVLEKNDPTLIQNMNLKAFSLGLEDTHFSNAVGWDEDDNYSSAYDLSRLMITAISVPLILQAISTQETTVVSQEGISYLLTNTNKLFDSFLDEVGGKTGTTDEAGPSLVNIFKTPNNHKVLTVLLNSKDRYTETKILSFWILKNYTWK